METNKFFSKKKNCSPAMKYAKALKELVKCHFCALAFSHTVIIF